MKYIMFAMLLMCTSYIILTSGFVLPTIIALIVLIIAVLLDFFTTWRCLKRGGKEGNPMIAYLFKKVGVAGTFGLVAGVWVWFIVFRWLSSTEGIQTAVALTYWLVPINNIMVLKGLNRKSHL